jgi:hypothetical protein
MKLLHWTGYGLLLANLTWIYYTAIMRLVEVRRAGLLDEKKNRFLFGLAGINIVIGIILDVLLNWTVGTIILLELPKEALTTDRLCRWYESASTREIDVKWRKPIAAWVGAVLLDNIDVSGKHIK